MRFFFSLSENVCEMSLFAEYSDSYENKFSHEERCYSGSLFPTLFHIGQARQPCPKLTSSSRAKVDLLKRHLVREEKHQGIKNSSYSQHDTERLWTKCLGSTPGDQKKTNQKRDKIISNFCRFFKKKKDLVEEVSCRRRQSLSEG